MLPESVLKTGNEWITVYEYIFLLYYALDDSKVRPVHWLKHAAQISSEDVKESALTAKTCSPGRFWHQDRNSMVAETCCTATSCITLRFELFWQRDCRVFQGDQVYKSVFIIFFQGDQLKSRVNKICEGWVCLQVWVNLFTSQGGSVYQFGVSLCTCQGWVL